MSEPWAQMRVIELAVYTVWVLLVLRTARWVVIQRWPRS